MRLFILALALYIPAHAAKKIDLAPKAEPKAEDPGSATSLLYKTTGPDVRTGTDSKIAVSATCTDAMGMVVKQTDKGYEACLRNMDRVKPRQPNEKNPNSVGISFGN